MHALLSVLPTFEASGGRPARPERPAVSPQQALAEAVAEAEERGFRRGLETAHEDHEQRWEAARAASETQLKAERARWAEEEGTKLAEQVREALAALEDRLAETTAGVLLPLVDSALARKAAAELVETVRLLLAQERRPLIQVSGPQEMLDALSAGLGAVAGSIELTPDSGVDARVLAGDAMVETQLQCWSQRLTEAMEAGSDG